MDDRQRYNDIEEMLRIAIDGLMAMAWTGLPGYIVSYDASTVTATVQIGVQGSNTNPDGSQAFANYPVLNGVPVEFPGGGGCRLTFPVAEGDECWVSFGCRAIGAWKQYGGVQVPNDPRRHHFADAICHIGPMSQANKLSNVSATTVQLRSQDNSTHVELDPAGQIVNIVAPGGMKFTTPTAHFTGNITSDQTITGSMDVVGGGKSLKSHVHSGVQSGGSNSGPPV